MDKIFATQDDLLKVNTAWFNKFGKLEKELDDQKVLTNNGGSGKVTQASLLFGQ